MATYDVTINGVSLNSTNRGVDEFNGRRVVPRRRTVGIEVPGWPGESVHVGAFESSAFSLGMWFIGANPGETPNPARLEQELDAVLKLFTARGLVEVRWLHPSGVWRVAQCKVATAVTPEIDHDNCTATLKVGFENPSCFWSGPNTLTFQSTTFNAGVPASSFTNATGAISDITLTVPGPISNPVIFCGNMRTEYVGSVPAGSTLVLRNAQQRATVGGVPVSVQQSHPRFFELTPGDSIHIAGPAAGGSTPWSITYLPTYT